MSTRSSARNLFPPLNNPELTIRRRSRVDSTLLNDFEMATNENGDPPVLDLQTMEELCQPTLNGWGGPISSIAIQATNFGLKNDMIQQSIKVNGVTDDALRLYLFPHSLTHHATAWFDRLPRNSMNTFEQMAKMFLGKYFPPSMVTKLRNEITNFCQRPDESLFKAWERGTFMKRRPEECYDLIENTTAHHNDSDTLAQRSDSSSSITSSSDLEIVALKAEMVEINKNLMKVLQNNQQVKAVTHNCETYGGPHSYNDCPATVVQTQNVYAAGAYQGGNFYQPQGTDIVKITKKRAKNYKKSNTSQKEYTRAGNYQEKSSKVNIGQPACPHHGFTKLAQIDNFYNGLNDNDQDSLNAAASGNLLSKTTREALQIIENKSKVRYSRNKLNVSRMNTTSRENASKTDDRIDKLADQILTLVDIFDKKVVTPTPVKANQSSNSGTLLSNTIPNPKGEMKAITTRSGVAYEGPLIPTFKKVVEQETEETTDKEQTNFQGSTAHIQPPVTLILEPDVPKTLPKLNIPDPSRLNDQKLRKKATNQMEKFFQIFQDFHFDISFVDALLLMPKFASTIKSLLTNKDKLFELAKIPLNENCSAVLLKKLLEKLGDPDKFLIPYDFPGMDTTRCSYTYDDLSVNRIDIIDVVREEYAQEFLGFSNNSSSSNPTLTSERILSDSSLSLTPFEGSDFILEEIKAYLKDESISLEIDHANCDHEDLDTFSSVRRPKNSSVIWKKKGSSNTFNVGLSA
nr:reverse transcriptase domain-containing protein [Tanacetum cinerariifolium]